MILLTDLIGRVGNLSALKDFISFLGTVKGDLSNITAPPFILSPQSLTEFPAYWAERPSLFAATASEPSAERRMLNVLQIYLTSLQRQYYIGQPVESGTKKPLNPFLGELFFCECCDPEGRSKVEVICEQVSHHPPTTACFIRDQQNGVRAEAYSTQHTSLSGTSVVVRQSGHAILTVDKYKESYLFPFPDVYAKSILTGSPYPELQGTYKLFSTSGCTAEITFGGKSMNPFSSSERNGFEASVYKTTDASKKSIFQLQGVWSSKWTIADGRGQKISTYDLSDPNNQPVAMRLPDSPSPWESRRAWKDVAEPLRKGNFSVALDAKSQLEQAQRDLRKKEKASGKKWQSAFFKQVNEGEEASQESKALAMLLAEAKGSIDAKNVLGNNGCWRFDPAKEKKWRAGQTSWPATPFG
ncbi:uncharacterized protein HMPREF1541_06710 [Cyphellophora europaea CBS 101466]|uniref:Oxysterol-binding protein n=1 Tax=Cyphellophora europaea (strain CBS 101466) TaxID=1220924 RepID=W2RSE8_CYPE1|nr:uncharacterized protein HMPREF1541_06710 [Cyphellophora europaea CBS 101466]ETN38673.1 hypothetical protein HMPREF1541_06710 [Cyphellophora europaea CBS 101466]